MNPKTTVGDYEIVDGGNMGESWVDVYAADRLWTPRKINGVYFDGTKDIVIPASGFGIGYINTTLALQAIPEKYTTSDYSPFEEDSILATLDAYMPIEPVNDSGIEYVRTLETVPYERYKYTGSITKAIPSVELPEGASPLYTIVGWSAADGALCDIIHAPLNTDLTWEAYLDMSWPFVYFELREMGTNTTITKEPRTLGIPYSLLEPEDTTGYTYLHNIVKPYDIAWLICGLTASGQQELAEKYVSNLLATRDIGFYCFYKYFDLSTGFYKNKCLETTTSAMCTYALAFFASKYPNSSISKSIRDNMSSFIGQLLTTCDDIFYTSNGTYGSELTNFSTSNDMEKSSKDNILGYIALKFSSTLINDTRYDGLLGWLKQVLLTELWNAKDGYFYYSTTDHATQDCITQALGAIFLKQVGDTDKLAKCLKGLDKFYTICNDGVGYVEPAAGYRLTPDDDGISFEATFITALARMGNGQLNRGMSDIVSARNMFEELKGSLLINKSNQTRELPAWPTLLSVGMPLVLRKPNGLFGLEYDIHDAGHEDAVHIHNASEILGLGDVTGGGAVTELDDVTLIDPVDGDVLTYDESAAVWVNKPNPDPTAFTVSLADGVTCVSGNILASTATGYVLADCKSVSTLQGLVYATSNSIGSTAIVKNHGYATIMATSEDIGKSAYIGYNGVITLTPTQVGNEYIKSVGTVKSATELFFSSDSLAIRVYLNE